MLATKKFDVVDAYEHDKAEVYVAPVKNWEQEQKEQEFKQVLLEGRAFDDQRQVQLTSFKFFLWIK